MGTCPVPTTEPALKRALHWVSRSAVATLKSLFVVECGGVACFHVARGPTNHVMGCTMPVVSWVRGALGSAPWAGWVL